MLAFIILLWLFAGVLQLIGPNKDPEWFKKSAAVIILCWPWFVVDTYRNSGT